MKLNNFELEISPGLERADGYVVMQHGQTYRVRLRNLWPRRAEAAVFIDGKPIGTFRIEPQRSTWLERPPNDSGKFTFYLQGTPEAAQAGLVTGNPLNGLVQVTFTPEVERPKIVHRQTESERMGPEYNIPSWDVAVGASASAAPVHEYRSAAEQYAAQTSKGGSGQSLSAGGTGLSGYSGQQFNTVAALVLDHSQETTISLRLVGPSSDPRPLTAAVPVKANPVPEAVQ